MSIQANELARRKIIFRATYHRYDGYSVPKAINGLTPNKTYHCRVVGQNSGGTTNGADMTFITSGNAPTITDVNPIEEARVQS